MVKTRQVDNASLDCLTRSREYCILLLLPAQRWLGRLPADTGHLTFFQVDSLINPAR